MKEPLTTEISLFAIQTGPNFFDYEEPSKSTMELEDVAHALSMVCRWAGHIKEFYSICQHALMVSDILMEWTADPYMGLAGLHHDDHEAVRGDIPSPRKRYLREHKVLFPMEEKGVDDYIFTKLVGIAWPPSKEQYEIMKKADRVALFTERNYLKAKPKGFKWNEVDKEYKPLSRKAFDDYRFDLIEKDFAYWKDRYLDQHAILKEMLNEAV